MPRRRLRVRAVAGVRRRREFVWKKTPGGMKAAIYCRVSTKEQTKNLSLPTQRRACEEYCQRHSLEVGRGFVEEGESAKTTERPEFQKLLAFCREHKGEVQHVIVYSINRFARNSYDHAIVGAFLKQFGVTLRSVTEPISEDSTGKLMQNMLAAIAQFDNDVRAERTIAGMKAALERGRWTFDPPLGYRRAQDAMGGPTIAPDPDCGPLVRKAF